MNIIFLSLVSIRTIEERGIYQDLLREFVKAGHYVRIISAAPGEPTRDIRRDGYGILQVDVPRMQKTSLIRKGIASLRIGPVLRRAIARHCGDEHYDLILLATPPITLVGTVGWLKRRDGAKVYLMLKDIWPQAIADLGAISQNGPIYRYYRSKEKALYSLADRIGCMSAANVRYLLEHDPQIDPARVEICPNSEEPVEPPAPGGRAAVRERYGIPQDKTVFLYGGNLGRPQGVPFLIECLRRCADMEEAFFVVCGTGTEYPKLEAYAAAKRPKGLLLLSGLPREGYEELASACDVGLLFLDYRFTIPNFPSRLLSYLQMAMPVIACTDPSTDVGDVAVEGSFGWKCLSNDADAFAQTVARACRADRAAMGAAARAYLLAHYTAERSCRIILGK
nr:glycosyltransferase family 4 protein [uncultured Oscillibacter sp.]